MKLKIPPPVYMLLFAGLMWLLNQYYPVYRWQFNTQTIGIAIIIIGALIDSGSLFLFLLSRTTVNPMKPEQAQIFVDKGMYRFSRNPMYLGLLLFLIGWSLYLGAISVLLLLPLFVWLINIMQIHHEEEILAEKFGHSYLEYKKRVRRWL